MYFARIVRILNKDTFKIATKMFIRSKYANFH